MQPQKLISRRLIRDVARKGAYAHQEQSERRCKRRVVRHVPNDGAQPRRCARSARGQWRRRRHRRLERLGWARRFLRATRPGTLFQQDLNRIRRSSEPRDFRAPLRATSLYARAIAPRSQKDCHRRVIERTSVRPTIKLSRAERNEVKRRKTRRGVPTARRRRVRRLERRVGPLLVHAPTLQRVSHVPRKPAANVPMNVAAYMSA